MSERISDIDFVMIWVDGNDLEWRKSKAKYNGDEELFNINDVRYRDWDTLHYWFRCVEKFAPWVRKIHFVTCGHVPQWAGIYGAARYAVDAGHGDGGAARCTL